MHAAGVPRSRLAGRLGRERGGQLGLQQLVLLLEPHVFVLQVSDLAREPLALGLLAQPRAPRALPVALLPPLPLQLPLVLQKSEVLAHPLSPIGNSAEQP